MRLPTGKPFRIAVIGAGTMGTNHARVIAQSSEAELVAVIDPERANAEKVAGRFGGRPESSLESLEDCDGAIVASPTATHRAIVLELLERGVPTLVEKPLSESVDECRALVREAERRSIPIACGFVERFNPVIATAFDLLDSPPIHILAIRHSPPTPRIATSVVHDLLIHDLDLVGRLCPTERSLSNARGWRPTRGGPLEIVDATIAFGGSTVATLSADRWTQRKIRSITISTESALLELDLVRQNLTVYRHVSHELRGEEATYRAETTIDIPFIRHSGEPLALQLEHFIRLARGDEDVVAEREGILPPHVLAAEIEDRASSP